jgi:AcrR family transcriptional regulator
MELTREQLFRQVWSEPLGKIAARFGLTGNGLAKICDRLNIPRPPRSHWTRPADSRDEPPSLPPPPIGLSEELVLGRRQTRQSPGKRTRLDSETRRRQIRDAAARIAVEDGLNALTIRALAQRVGISETQVHNCIGSRTDLLVALARQEVAKLEANRRTRVSRSMDRHTKIVLSTIGYLHEAAANGPLLQMLLRVPEVKTALRDERDANARAAREPIIQRMTSDHGMDRASARAATAALTAISLKAGGIVAGKRAPLSMVEEICIPIIMAGVTAVDLLGGDRVDSADI